MTSEELMAILENRLKKNKIPWHLKYAGWHEDAQNARDRIAQPVVVDGVTYVRSAEAAEYLGCTKNFMNSEANRVRGDNLVLTSPRGWRFIRLPRHRQDKKGLLYWDLDSLTKKERKHSRERL